MDVQVVHLGDRVLLGFFPALLVEFNVSRREPSRRTVGKSPDTPPHTHTKNLDVNPLMPLIRPATHYQVAHYLTGTADQVRLSSLLDK